MSRSKTRSPFEFSKKLLTPLSFASHIVLLLHCLGICDATLATTGPNCADVCPSQIRDDMLNVHLVPHTHDDVGWLKTVDQYYYGTKQNIVPVAVKYILDSVVSSLERDATRTFIYVEMAFFWRWWMEQSQSRRDSVRRLVKNRQLQFVSGGWSMNDEGTVHYNAVIDQMTLGLKFIKDNFGKCARPTVGWQIDPFGHSREYANLFSQMGMQGLFFGRIDYQDKSRRMDEKELEMIWIGSDDNPLNSSLFTSTLFNAYGPPTGFSFDVMYSNEPLVEDPNSPEYNVEERINEFITNVKIWSDSYKTNHILLPMGNDFTYTGSVSWFDNMDKIIKHVNANQNSNRINVLYSSPACYLKSVQSVSNVTWPVKTDDFFPYASDPTAYWTGYFTSRPSLKRIVREGNNLLQICKQISFLDPKSVGVSRALNVLGKSMAVLQHHDGVSGTAKQHVTDDYLQRIYKGMVACRKVISRFLSRSETVVDSKSGPGEVKGKIPYKFCQHLNVSQCHLSETSNSFIVKLYNPVAKQNVLKHVRIPVDSRQENFDYIVKDLSNGSVVMSQIVPISDSVLAIPGRTSSATHEVVFSFQFEGGLSSKRFLVERSTSHKKIVATKLPQRGYMNGGKDSLIHFNRYGDIYKEYRAISSSKQSRISKIKVHSSFAYYETKANGRQSGAYIFRPSSSGAITIQIDPSKTKFYKGPVVDELHMYYQNFSSVGQVIRMYHDTINDDHTEVEVDWIVGPINVNDGQGKEVVMQYTSNIESDNIFYTDAWGRQMMKRVRDFRPTWNYTVVDKISGNYYPVNSRIFVEDGNASGGQSRRLTVLTDRSEGGTSMQSGQIELMLHRRCLNDDGFGVDEPLNEIEFGEGLVARGTHVLQLTTNKTEGNIMHRMRGETIFMNSVMAFKEYSNPLTGDHKGAEIKLNLPKELHLLTLEVIQQTKHESRLLIRVENMFGGGELPGYGTKSFNLAIFNRFGYDISNIQELGLGANTDIADMEVLEWNTSEAIGFEPRKDDVIKKFDEKRIGTEINLKPMEIRTFLLTLRRNGIGK